MGARLADIAWVAGRARPGKADSALPAGVECRAMILPLLLLACSPDPTPVGDSGATASGPVPWTSALPDTDGFAPLRGLHARRAIIHLHSPWSHDACDGEPLPDGSPDLDCLQDLRDGLCTTHVDGAFLTDHSSYAAVPSWEDLLLAQPGDEPVEVDGEVIANRITCPNGHQVTWMPGLESGMMVAGLHHHLGDDEDSRRAVYESESEEAIQAEIGAGAIILQAHTEQRDPADLERWRDEGLTGFEIFNLHAAFAPDIRSDYLGLDPMDWLAQIAPFTDPHGTAEPDLLFLAVLLEQAPSIAAWDQLLATGPVLGTGGTDAHQNVLPGLLRDGERGDSYRRMLRWFSNQLLVEGEEVTPDALEDAMRQGRNVVTFEALGTPQGFDFWLEASDGAAWEIGSTAPPGTLHLVCPTLHPESPQGAAPPEISATLLEDGLVVMEGCGDFEARAGHVYRPVIEMLPRHLTEMLGESPEPWMRRYPWLYANPIRVEAP